MPKKTQGTTNSIRRHRLRKGWSQAALGQLLGIGRQAVYDMECGRYLPNTGLALTMAELFACSVETLFHNRAEEGRGAVGVAPRLVPLSGPRPASEAGPPLRPGTRLALAHVRGELVGVPLHASGSSLLPSADAFVDSSGTVGITSPPELIRQTLLLFGCNPALELLESHMKRQLASSRLRCIFASSGRALDTLAEGNAHIAATHFHSADGDDANAREAAKRLSAGFGQFVQSGRPGQSGQSGQSGLAGQSDLADLAGRAGQTRPAGLIGGKFRLMSFCANEEGLMVAPGNPCGIRTVADMAGVRFVNREPGAALRKLLDECLLREGLAPQDLPGYDALVYSHHEGACRVAFGAADAALGLRVVAHALGLDFIPLAATSCDLVIPEDVLDDPAVDALLQALCSSRLRNELHGLPGFDASGTGRERLCP